MTGADLPSARLCVSNRTEWPRIVWVEPWGEDFTILPGESLEIAIFGGQSTNPPYFALNEYPQSTAVYLEGDFSDYAVIKDTMQIPCGHQRQAALDAGLRF